MASWIYDYCRVIRPMVDPGELTTRAADWQTAVTSTAQGLGEMDAAINIIKNRNKGKGADAFVTRMTGPSSARYAVDALSRASSGFYNAHAASATALQTCVTSMDTLAATAETAIMDVLAKSGWDTMVPKIFSILVNTRSKLVTMQNTAETAINNAYSGFLVEKLPDTQPLSNIDNPDRGIVDPAIREQWAKMSPEERRAVLEEIVRQQAIANGMDPNTSVTWENDPNGAFGSWNGEGVTLNEAFLNDPSLMHTAVHEMRHALQDKMKAEYEGMDPATRAAIRSGAQADPFAKYGTNIDEVDEMSKRKYIGPDPDWPKYHAQPVEVDARTAGREQGAGMSYQTFQERMKQAGVPVR